MATVGSRAPREPEGFIAWENARKRRYELLGGEIRMMTGGTVAHNRIMVNVATALHSALRGSTRAVHFSEIKIVSPVGMVTYPDVLVRCGPIDDEATQCDDPVVIVEVLSPSTRSNDLVRKRWAYQAIPSLQHLVYVDPGKVEVELSTRDPGGGWRSIFVADPGDSLRLDALDITLPMAAIYEG